MNCDSLSELADLYLYGELESGQEEEEKQGVDSQYAAWTPLTECFFIHGISERRRAPTFSIECFSPFFKSAL